MGLQLWLKEPALAFCGGLIDNGTMKSKKLIVKSKKLTSVKKPAAARRWYDDACGSAQAMEALGERWALLIVRELMFGPRRFGDLKGALGGISAQTLTQRLEGLEASGVLLRRMLPPPANAPVYELTEWGYESEPILCATGRWGARAPDHDAALPLSAASMMLSFKTMFLADRAGGFDARIGFHFGRDTFAARASAKGFSPARGETKDCDIVFETRPEIMAALAYGGLALERAEAEGTLVFAGDRRRAARFFALLELPPKAARPA